ncbi:choice-of-anchor B family protein [Bacteroidota bacterium]|nr:choice-of-anchor B family protein [Bacteroidota bacterium]
MIKSIKFRYIFSKIEINLIINFILLFASIKCSKNELSVNNFEEVEILQEENQNNSEKKIFIFDKIDCVAGFANEFPCKDYDLLSWIPLSFFGSESANDNWGWTDYNSKREFVLQGLNDGLAFLDITDPQNVIFVGKLLSATDPSDWRDVKIYNNYAFVVSEASNHGLQVFNLNRILDLDEFKVFNEDYTANDFGNAHNIAINPSTGFAYILGSALYEGGPVFYDISVPEKPILKGGFSDTSYIHDAQIITYKGIDQNYFEREILFGSNSDGGETNQLIILDVTDKTNPKLISKISYSYGGYTHQGWIDENHRYFYLGDELDELRYGNKTRIIIFDLKDLKNPKIHFVHEGKTNAIDHNLYIKSNKLYLSNYTAGLREFDIQNIENQEIIEEAFFDTYPESDDASFDGVWNSYPFFESGVIAVSDINRGLFLIKRK